MQTASPDQADHAGLSARIRVKRRDFIAIAGCAVAIRPFASVAQQGLGVVGAYWPGTGLYVLR
jgi:hypothetical protein